MSPTSQSRTLHIFNVVKKWAEEGMKETPEEMIDYITSFILKFYFFI